MCRLSFSALHKNSKINDEFLLSINISCNFYLIFFAEKAPSEATFRGTDFLSYDLGQTGGEPIVSAQDAISLYFRTRQPNGLLFFTGKIFTDICYFLFK